MQDDIMSALTDMFLGYKVDSVCPCLAPDAVELHSIISISPATMSGPLMTELVWVTHPLWTSDFSSDQYSTSLCLAIPIGITVRAPGNTEVGYNLLWQPTDTNS